MRKRPRRRRLFASARARILASYLILLLFSTVVEHRRAARGPARARVGERVDDALAQEVRGVPPAGARRPQPAYRRAFGNDVRAIFGVFLSRNVPGEGEAFFTFVNGGFYAAAPGTRELTSASRPASSCAGTDASRRGEFETGRRGTASATSRCPSSWGAGRAGCSWWRSTCAASSTR